jgi:hypothetical protein
MGDVRMSAKKFWTLYWALFIVLAALGAWFLGNLAYTVLWTVLGKMGVSVTEPQMATYIAANLLPFVLILIVGGALSLLVRNQIATASAAAVNSFRAREVEVQEAHTKALERQANALEKQNRENDPIVKRIRAKQEQDLQPPKPRLRLSFDMNDAGCVRRNTIVSMPVTLRVRDRPDLTEQVLGQANCDWYRIRIDAQNGNVSSCQARLISVTRGGSPLLTGDTPPLPIAHGAANDGTKTIHEGVPDYIDLLAIFQDNTVDLCVPPERRTSSINWGMFDLASDYEIKVAVTSPDAKTISIDVILRWTLDRMTSEIVCKPSQ